jgi:plasmid stabilization system protein ParE
MRLRWTMPAANDLFDIVQRIRREDPAAAAKVATVIYDGC